MWDPNVALGFGWLGHHGLGGQFELQYHALMDHRPRNLPYAPSTADYVAFAVGLRIQL